MIRALAATATLATLGSVAVTAPATAHTPAIAADCDGVIVKATNYDANATNRWTVTIAGVTQTGTFGATYTGTFPVPQAGATTDWSASIDAPGTRYDLTRSGTVGPCGTPPRAAPAARGPAGWLAAHCPWRHNKRAPMGACGKGETK